MASIQKTYTFSPNTIAQSQQVNQNFDDLIDILKAHHHDPNVYSNASPITTSGIAENALIGAVNQNQLATITASGKVQSNTALQQITQDGIIAASALPNYLGSRRFSKIEIDDDTKYIDTDGSGNLIFSDPIVGTKTLNQLAVQGKQSLYLEPIDFTNTTRKIDSTFKRFYAELLDSAVSSIYFMPFYIPSGMTIGFIKMLVGYGGSASGNIVVDYQFYGYTDGDSRAMESDSAKDSLLTQTINAVTPQNTIRLVSVPTAAYDGLVAGNTYVLKLTRQGTHANDTLTAEFQIYGAIIEFTQ